MKPINIQDTDKYPENYNNLSIDTQNKIINYMNGMQALAERYYNKYFLDSEEKSLKLYQHTLTSLTGAKNAYATMNIMVEYDWPGHKGIWFLANKEDAQNYINAEDDETSEVINNISDLLDYTEVGI